MVHASPFLPEPPNLSKTVEDGRGRVWADKDGPVTFPYDSEFVHYILSLDMANSNRLFEMARKWQSLARKGSKRSVYMRSDSFGSSNKGHFVVYAIDGRRYVVPLAYLNQPSFRELLEMAEEEFGLEGQLGPLTVPCDGQLLDSVLSMLGENERGKKVEEAEPSSIACFCPGPRGSTSLINCSC
ncbi:Auxin-induced protein X10A [Nymphaea thermarum]|nr:Auxin-induced protein X10A [Nymphaea thermarum]